MVDEFRGGEDSAAPRDEAREGRSVSPGLIETVKAIIAALQADGRVTEPGEIARLTYLLQHLVAQQARQAEPRLESHPATTAPEEPETL